MQKPMLFLSHVHEDQNLAITLENVVRAALLGGVEVFNSSNRRSISAGDPWRDVIVERLRTSRTVLVLATPESVTSPWVNFEAGGAWVAGNRVIPCCAKGMTPSSLPTPLSHLQAIDLSSSDDVRMLVKLLADMAQLDAPSHFDYDQAATTLTESWRTSSSVPSNENFLSWIEKVSRRPRRYKGETCQGFANAEHITAVTPFEAYQLPDEEVVAGDSIKCWLKPIGRPFITEYHCFASGDVADTLSEIEETTLLEVTVKCLGQIKVYTTDHVLFEEERGIEYPMALLIEKAMPKL